MSGNGPIIKEISKVEIKTGERIFTRSITKTDNVFVLRSSFIDEVKNGTPFNIEIDLDSLDPTKERSNFNSIALLLMVKLNETQWSWGSLLHYPRCLFGVCINQHVNGENGVEKRYIRDYDRIIIYHTCSVGGVVHDCLSVVLIPYFIGTRKVELDVISVVVYPRGTTETVNPDIDSLVREPLDLLRKCFGLADIVLNTNTLKFESDNKLTCLHFLLNLANYMSVTNINVASKLKEYMRLILDGNFEDTQKMVEIMEKSLFIGRAPFIFPYSLEIKNTDYKRLGEITPERITTLINQKIILKVGGLVDVSAREIGCNNGDSDEYSDSDLGGLSSEFERIIRYNYPPTVNEIESCSED